MHGEAWGIASARHLPQRHYCDCTRRIDFWVALGINIILIRTRQNKVGWWLFVSHVLKSKGCEGVLLTEDFRESATKKSLAASLHLPFRASAKRTAASRDENEYITTSLLITQSKNPTFWTLPLHLWVSRTARANLTKILLHSRVPLVRGAELRRDAMQRRMVRTRPFGSDRLQRWWTLSSQKRTRRMWERMSGRSEGKTKIRSTNSANYINARPLWKMSWKQKLYGRQRFRSAMLIWLMRAVEGQGGSWGTLKRIGASGWRW